MTQEPSASFEAIYDSGSTGLVGTIAVAIHDNLGAVVVGPQTTGITEIVVNGVPTAMYSVVLTAPATVGQYAIVWSNDGSFDPNTGGIEDLVVSESILGLSALPPLTDFGPGTTPPCSA